MMPAGIQFAYRNPSLSIIKIRYLKHRYTSPYMSLDTHVIVPLFHESYLSLANIKRHRLRRYTLNKSN